MRRLLQFVLTSIALILMGCGRQEPREASKTESPANRPAPAVEAIVETGETKETVRVWSTPVKSQLNGLADLLVGKDEELGSYMTEQVETIDPSLWTARVVYDQQPVTVSEVTPPKDASPDMMASQAFEANLRSLLMIPEDSPKNKVKFKLYGIDQSPGRLTTRQRLMAKGSVDGKPAASYAVVDAVWETPADDDAAPRLASFSTPVVMRTVWEAGESLGFKDIANQLFKNNESWPAQLQVGMNAWVRAIERSLNPDFLGYHGIAIGDVDGDGLEDVYLCQPGGLPNLLFKQQTDGTLVDISKQARVDWLDNSTAALLVDLDNDGDRDLAVATRTAFLIMANNGAGQFSLQERLSNLGMGYSPTATDYDLDGDLDLLVLRYAGDGSQVGSFPTPHPFHSARNGGANVLLENEGDFSFNNVTDDKGLGVENYRFSFAASWEDYDNDGDPDLYIANDFGPNQLFRNEGGAFIDESIPSNTQDWGFGMSATWGDYDRDGFMDLYVSSMFSGAGNQVVAQTDFNPTMPNETRRKYMKMVRGNTLMRNAGNGTFADETNPANEGFAGWAWGAQFADWNNDGWEDLYVANGYISQPDTDDL